MAIIMCCPYYIREIQTGKLRRGVLCKGGEIRFANKETRRAYVYPLCASVDGYVKCPIYKALSSKADV